MTAREYVEGTFPTLASEERAVAHVGMIKDVGAYVDMGDQTRDLQHSIHTSSKKVKFSCTVLRWVFIREGAYTLDLILQALCKYSR